MINSSYGLKGQPFLDIIYSTKEKAVFKQIRICLRGGLHEKNDTLDISDSSNYVGVSMACGYIHKR